MQITHSRAHTLLFGQNFPTPRHTGSSESLSDSYVSVKPPSGSANSSKISLASDGFKHEKTKSPDNVSSSTETSSLHPSLSSIHNSPTAANESLEASSSSLSDSSSSSSRSFLRGRQPNFFNFRLNRRPRYRSPYHFTPVFSPSATPLSSSSSVDIPAHMTEGIILQNLLAPLDNSASSLYNSRRGSMTSVESSRSFGASSVASSSASSSTESLTRSGSSRRRRLSTSLNMLTNLARKKS